MKIFVTGGAGYIGSHMVRKLYERGHDIVTLDDLSMGVRDALMGGEFVQGSVQNLNLLADIFSKYAFDIVFHFAGRTSVEESVRTPSVYYENNVIGILNLLNAMQVGNVNKLVFSSSAAVYGLPKFLPIDEQHQLSPINPYGMTKLISEQILNDYAVAYGIRSISLRYFNAAGAAVDGRTGESHDPETHLIPLAIRAAIGVSPALTIFGDDYDTADGTCIRDYVHVVDICDAHELAMKHLMNGGGGGCFNIGSERGYSVNEVLKTVEFVTGKRVPVKYGVRRIGDPPTLVANANKIRIELNWRPKHNSLEEIVKHAWKWELKKLR